MLKRIIIGVLAVAGLLAGVGWLYRKDIILYAVTSSGRMNVAPNRPIAWMQGPATPALPARERPPNIIFILADDLGINDITTFRGGVAGGRVPTPNIDRLAAQGAVFTNGYSGTGTCAPSRAMLMTGRYPTRTGFEFTPTPNGLGRIVSMLADGSRGKTGMPPMTWNEAADRDGPKFNERGLPGEEVTVAEVLKTKGYHNVHIGKWHLGGSAPFRAVSQGFDESLLLANGLHLPEDDPNVVNAKLPFDPLDRFLWARLQFAADYDRAGEAPVDEPFAPGGYLANYWTDEALKVIEANRNRPFFLYLAHWGVHTPLQATKEDYDAVGDIQPHRLRVYAAMVRSVDRSVGRILDKLEQEGLAENTIIVFSSDNGGAGYLGLPEVNAPYRGWKITLFEGGIRVPMFIKWPARIAPGTVIAEPAAHVDVMPTLAAAAGAALPEGVAIDGQNLLPAAMRQGTITRPDDAIFWSSGFYKVVRAGGWKLQVNERQKRSWLFNLADDPAERNDLASSRPEKRAELQALIDKHWANARKPLYPSSTESPICIDRTLADLPCPKDDYVIWPN
jgi:uncharacterized sulfatase